jgi:hypothetical protein
MVAAKKWFDLSPVVAVLVVLAARGVDMQFPLHTPFFRAMKLCTMLLTAILSSKATAMNRLRWGSLLFHDLAKQHVLVAQVQFAVGNDRVRPVRCLTAVGMLESATLNVLLGAGLEQDHRAVLLEVVDAAVGQGDRALLNAPAAGLVALVPQDLAGLEVEANQVTTSDTPA